MSNVSPFLSALRRVHPALGDLVEHKLLRAGPPTDQPGMRLDQRLIEGSDELSAPMSTKAAVVGVADPDAELLLAREALRLFSGASPRRVRKILLQAPDMWPTVGSRAISLLRSDDMGERELALLILRLLSEAGDLGSIYNLAVELIRGVHMPRDMTRADAMLSKLQYEVPKQAQPVLWAMVRCQQATILEHRGYLHAALRKFEEAAPFWSEAAYAVGLAYDQNPERYGISRDAKTAIRYYEMAIAMGHVESFTSLGVLIVIGQYPARDPADGWEMLRTASAAGDTVADDAMRRLEEEGWRE